jgi:hypothetical protein
MTHSLPLENLLNWRVPELEFEKDEGGVNVEKKSDKIEEELTEVQRKSFSSCPPIH